MDWGAIGVAVLVLACPLMMIMMMRGGGHGGHDHDSHQHSADPLTGMSEEQLHELARRAGQEIEERHARDAQ